MRGRSTRLAGGAWLCLLVSAALVLGSPHAALAAQGEKHVLVLYSLRPDAELSIAGNRTLPRILGEALPEGVDFHSEYIDLARFSDPEYQTAFRDFLALKYRRQKLDLVIAILDTACQFIEENRRTLFPDIPVVLFALNPRPSHVQNSTVVLSQLDFGRTIRFATALQPDTRQIFVVSGASARDQAYERVARAQFQAFESSVAFTYLSGLPTGELVRRVATLPEHSILYYVLANQDGAGEAVHPLEYLDTLAASARVPIYSWVDSAMDHGILGGGLLGVDAQVDAIANRSLRVLRGEPADAIPAAVPDLYLNQIDWRQLRRWNISESRVPAGTHVRFREPGTWERYRSYILGAAAFMAAQTLLIAGLLVQRTRRRRAEEDLRGKQSELRASYDRIRDLGGRLISAQENERARIARELHDDVSQQLARLAIDLDRLRRAGAGRTDGRGRQLTDEVLTRAHGIARTVHDLSHRLHPARLRLVGLVAALDGLRRELSAPGLTISFEHDEIPAALPHDLTLCLYRIVQEALHNAVVHSGAGHASVQVRVGPDSVALIVVDDGGGFDVDAAWARGLGLLSMSERLEPFGGTLIIRSTPGDGTRLEATVPYRAVDANTVAS